MSLDQKLGIKRNCNHCSAKFYDLNKSPIICPKCGQELILKPYSSEAFIDDMSEYNDIDNLDF